MVTPPSLTPNKRLTTLHQRDPVKANSDSIQMELDGMSTKFGKNSEFNRLMYNDDNVLMTLNVKLKNPKYKATIDVTMDHTTALCTYSVTLNGGKFIAGTTTASSKKAARKDAARKILARMECPTTEELEEITKWMVAGHRSNIAAQEMQLSKDFSPAGHIVTLRWTVGNNTFDGYGTSNSLKLAEMYALQDLYCKTQGLAQQVQSTGETDHLPKAKSTVTKEPAFVDELSKADACQMNVMRNTIANRMKVTQKESIVASGGGFDCTLRWSWTDPSGSTQQKVVCKHGTSKALAKAAASKAMMVEVGLIDSVSPQESAKATAIRDLMRTNLAKAVQDAAEFLQQTNCSVWRLFLPQLMDLIVQRCDRALVSPILGALSAANVKLPTDIWESILYLASMSIDETFCKTVINGIKNLNLDPRYFVSTRALEYYKTQSWLLSLEFNAEICSNITSIQGRGGKEVLSLLCNLTKTQLPLMFLAAEASHDYLKAPLKEEDMVMVVPHDRTYLWEKGLLCNLSKHKSEDGNVGITCKILNKINWETSDEVFDHKKFGVFLVTSTTTNKRMLQALQGITHRMLPINSSAHGYYYDKDLQRILLEDPDESLPQERTDNVVVRTNIPLTEAQFEACKSAIVNAVTLIQGPPGTGKTQVACAIIDCYRRASHEKILAVADSNVAADNLVEGLNRRGINALRIGFGTDSLLQEESLKGLAKYERYRMLRAAGMHKEANSLRAVMILEAVRKHQVIIATCIGSGNDILNGYSFPYVVIDECAQSIEASNLIPIGKGCKQLVLIGDHKQLRPTIVSQDASRGGLSISFLERLVSSKVAPVHLLDVQRRMHPSISEFPNYQFYGGRISDAIPDNARPHVKGFKWPNHGYNVAFIDVSSGHPQSHFETVVGTSRSNMLEAEVLLAVLRSILDAGDVAESQIGILTPYDAQKWLLKRKIQQLDNINAQNIEVDSVDGFQGKEKELILFSAVRSNMQKDVGFLRDPRRMNVMMTRARRGLIIIADRYTIMNERDHWKPYMDYVVNRGLDIHISQLNAFLDKPSDRLNDLIQQAMKGAYQ